MSTRPGSLNLHTAQNNEETIQPKTTPCTWTKLRLSIQAPSKAKDRRDKHVREAWICFYAAQSNTETIQTRTTPRTWTKPRLSLQSRTKKKQEATRHSQDIRWTTSNEMRPCKTTAKKRHIPRRNKRPNSTVKATHLNKAKHCKARYSLINKAIKPKRKWKRPWELSLPNCSK